MYRLPISEKERLFDFNKNLFEVHNIILLLNFTFVLFNN